MSVLPEDQIAAAARADWLLLEYDYFKHLSTIALVTVGAILTWVQGGKGGGTLVMLALTLLAMSATLGFSAMNQIIAHRKTGKKLRWLFGSERLLATLAFAAGLGMFMSEVGKAIN